MCDSVKVETEGLLSTGGKTRINSTNPDTVGRRNFQETETLGW